jgi:hypothetical protein
VGCKFLHLIPFTSCLLGVLAKRGPPLGIQLSRLFGRHFASQAFRHTADPSNLTLLPTMLFELLEILEPSQALRQIVDALSRLQHCAESPPQNGLTI